MAGSGQSSWAELGILDGTCGAEERGEPVSMTYTHVCGRDGRVESRRVMWNV